MKKIGILFVVVLCAMLTLGILTACTNDGVDLKFEDYRGKEILNLTTNTDAFLIKTERGAKVTVNGADHDVKRGIYEDGIYEVEATKNGETVKKTIHIKQLTSRNEYDIYVTYATLPTLYAGLEMAQSPNPKFIWYGRAGTLDEQTILEKEPNTVLSEHIGATLDIKVIDEVRGFIKDVLSKDKNAYFHLYVDDFRHWVEEVTLAKMGLNAGRYDVTLCSDGTYTYTKNYWYADDYTKFLDTVKLRDTMLDNARANQYADDATDYFMNGGKDAIDFYDDFIIPATLSGNVSYWMQYPELVKAGSDDIAIEYKKANFKKKLPEEMYQFLSAEQKEVFLAYINFDKASFDTAYFSEPNEKPYMIITGTNPLDATTMAYVAKVLDLYGDTYNYLFKPHPSAMPDETFQQQFDDLGIKVLPGRLPMEVITWVYPDAHLGGYNSSLYMSAPKGNTKFFFAADKNGLTSPLIELFDDLFAHCIFITLT